MVPAGIRLVKYCDSCPGMPATVKMSASGPSGSAFAPRLIVISGRLPVKPAVTLVTVYPVTNRFVRACAREVVGGGARGGGLRPGVDGITGGVAGEAGRRVGEGAPGDKNIGGGRRKVPPRGVEIPRQQCLQGTPTPLKKMGQPRHETR